MEYIKNSMIEYLVKKGITSQSVLNAMFKVPRHLFISEALRYSAYDDVSLPIGFGQTISKPSIIARMVQHLNLTGKERVLEIGTGSGYQSALLAELSESVVTIERISELSTRAGRVLKKLNYSNVRVKNTDDFNDTIGIFNSVIVSAGANMMLPDLFKKMSQGGILIIPVEAGSVHRIKRIIMNNENEMIEEVIGEAEFVPLIINKSA